MVACPGCGRLHEPNEITECACGWRGVARSIPPAAPLVFHEVRIRHLHRRWRLRLLARLGVVVAVAAAVLAVLVYLAARVR